MNRNIILLLAVITLVIVLGYFFKFQNNRINIPFNESKINVQNIKKEKSEETLLNKIQIKIGDKNYEIFVTESETDKKNGLSIFNNLKDNEGMLFEFEAEDFHAFWMKGMKFDIDIIFLDQNKKVVHLYENVQKESYKNENEYKIFIPKLKSKYVIELKSGEVKKNKISLGDAIIF